MSIFWTFCNIQNNRFLTQLRVNVFGSTARRKVNSPVIPLTVNIFIFQSKMKWLFSIKMKTLFVDELKINSFMTEVTIM